MMASALSRVCAMGLHRATSLLSWGHGRGGDTGHVRAPPEACSPSPLPSTPLTHAALGPGDVGVEEIQHPLQEGPRLLGGQAESGDASPPPSPFHAPCPLCASTRAFRPPPSSSNRAASPPRPLPTSPPGQPPSGAGRAHVFDDVHHLPPQELLGLLGCVQRGFCLCLGQKGLSGGFLGCRGAGWTQDPPPRGSPRAGQPGSAPGRCSPSGFAGQDGEGGSETCTPWLSPDPPSQHPRHLPHPSSAHQWPREARLQLPVQLPQLGSASLQVLFHIRTLK